MNERLKLERIRRSLSATFPDEHHILATAPLPSGGCHSFRISERTLDRIGPDALDELLRLVDKVSDCLRSAERAVRTESLMREEPAAITATYTGSQQLTTCLSGAWGRYLDQFVFACRLSIANAERRLSAMAGSELVIELASATGVAIEENINYRPREWRSNG